MRKLIFHSLLLFFALSASAKDFDPTACPDLTVKIYPGNGNWRVFHATSSVYMHSAWGYDFAGVLTTGKPSEKRMRTILRLDMGPEEGDLFSAFPGLSDLLSGIRGIER